MPEQQFASQNLGRDLLEITVAPVYQMRDGKAPYIFGYGSVVVADISISLLESLKLCSPTRTTSCNYPIFFLLTVGSLLGFIALLRKVQPYTQSVATIFLATFFLGGPMNKAIEAGNIDGMLAVLYGLSMILVLQSRSQKPSRTLTIAVGILLGVLLSTKAFFALFVILSLVYVIPRTMGILSFLGSYIFFSFWPWIYGVKSGLFDVFSFAIRSSNSFGPQLFTQVNYGNNAVIAYVSNTLQIIDTGIVSLTTHTLLTQMISMGILLILFFKPIVDEQVLDRFRSGKKWSWSKMSTLIHSSPFIVVLYVYATTAMLTITAWSYDYRLLYQIPIVFLLLSLATHSKTKTLLYWSIFFLLLKCLWIPKDRFLNIFLYLHYYLLIRASLSLWMETLLPKKSASQ